MTQEGGTPPDFWERVKLVAERAVDSYARSGASRNTSITGGGLTIRGGFFRMLSKAVNGVTQFYLGPSGAVLGDGSVQQILSVRRADGTRVLLLWDAFPAADGTLNQALSWIDRGGNIVISDDTDSGQGIARPYLPAAFYRKRYADLTVSTTSTTFETLWEARIYKQQPRLEVGARATMETSGDTGETRVLVNGVQLGATAAQTFLVLAHSFGPAAVAGAHMEALTVQIQGRVTSATGTLRVEPWFVTGQQS